MKSIEFGVDSIYQFRIGSAVCCSSDDSHINKDEIKKLFLNASEKLRDYAMNDDAIDEILHRVNEKRKNKIGYKELWLDFSGVINWRIIDFNN